MLVEHDGKKVIPATYSAIAAASKLGGSISALVAGSSGAEIAKDIAKVPGVAKVYVCLSKAYDHGLAENTANLLVEAQKKLKCTHVIAAHTAFGKDTVPRAAVLLDVAPISDIISIQDADTFVRPIYAGNAIAKVKSKDPIKFVTVRTTAFAPTGPKDANAPIENINEASKFGKKLLELVLCCEFVAYWIFVENTQFVSESLTQSDRPDIMSAKCVISGGRGLKDGKNFKLLYDLAEQLHAAVGASRAAVDAGYVDNSLQIGQTGKIVAPPLYIAVGISGAIQHLAGMKDSKCIVAINKDPEAPIFQVADYGLVADLFQVCVSLTRATRATRFSSGC